MQADGPHHVFFTAALVHARRLLPQGALSRNTPAASLSGCTNSSRVRAVSSKSRVHARAYSRNPVISSVVCEAASGMRVHTFGEFVYPARLVGREGASDLRMRPLPCPAKATTSSQEFPCANSLHAWSMEPRVRVRGARLRRAACLGKRTSPVLKRLYLRVAC